MAGKSAGGVLAAGSREAPLPILQLSALEKDGIQLPSNQESAETSVAREQMKSLLQQAIESPPERERAVYELREIRKSGRRNRPAQYQLSGNEIALVPRQDQRAAIPG